MIRNRAGVLAVSFCCVFLNGLALGQVVTGTPKFGSFGGGPFDTVNLGNNNVHFAISVMNKAGRGFPFTYDLNDDSSIWYPVGVIGNQFWTPVGNWGWRGKTEAAIGYVPSPSVSQLSCTFYDPPFRTQEPYTKYVYSGGYYDKFGVHHYVPGLIVYDPASDCGPQTTSITKTAADGSGLSVTVSAGATSAVVKTPSGQAYIVPVGSPSGSGLSKDANGNEITINTSGQFFDTLDATTPVLTVAGSGTQASPLTFTYTAPSGASAVYTMKFTNKTVRTYFRCSTVTDYPATANVPLVSEIDVPDYNASSNPNSRYTFTYEPSGDPNAPGSVTGRIASVTLPTGGTITYSYSGGTNGINCADGSTPTLTRTLGGGTWTYTRSGSGPWTTTVQDPNTNQATITFQKDSISNNFYETSRVITDSSGTLETVYTCYNGQSISSPSSCPATAVAEPLLRVTTFRGFNGSSLAEVDTQYDQSGNATEIDEYDFGATSPARRTAFLYGSYNATNDTCTALGNSIVDYPCKITVTDANGYLKSRTTFAYDETTAVASGITTNHVSVTGSRGNLTTLKRYSTSSTALTSVFKNYDTGNVYQSQDPNGQWTTYTYGACAGAFPTSISLPLSLSRSMTWNCTGGVMTQFTDENQQATDHNYTDPQFWRISSISYPDGGQTSMTYNTATLPWSIAINSKIDSTRNHTTKTVFDSLGRVLQTQLASDPAGTVYTDTTYDSVGRAASVSNPYRSTSDPTYGVTQYTYDALGRVTTVTEPGSAKVLADYNQRATRIQSESNGVRRIVKIYQSDGLGRLTSVCEVTSVTQLGITPTPSACGQDIAATGFLTSYQYATLSTTVAQGGLNSRAYNYDMLRRLVQESNPESGTTTYTYDTNSAADLYQRTAPKPNQTTPAVTLTTSYSYDALHRLTGKSYSDGSPVVNYFYDQTSAWNVSPQNPKGRMTGMAASGSTADSGFSYDAMGRLITEWQWTPLNSTGNAYPVNYTYDLLGDLISTNDANEGKTYTYTYDTAARLTKMQSSWNDANHPGTLLTVNTYNPLSQVQQATLGNGIVRNLHYDNRARMTSLSDGSVYSFTLGYAANSSILTGNDSLNGNWTYTYDDFSRIATSSRSGQAFNYKYDRYGNRWQQNVTTGSGPNPSYTFDANNHISGSGVVYDAAGNITNDGLGHTYTYDAENRVLSVGGSSSASYVYDAFGRRAQTTLNSSTHDYIYDSAGRMLTDLNPSWSRSELYAGGMHVATYSNSTTYFDHSDWLSTRRALSNVSGASVETCTSLPFGDAQTCIGTEGTPLHFTGQPLDSESNLHHFMFRQLSTTQGLWISPDPAGLAAVDPGNPQSWNRYAYAMNSPCTIADPFGLEGCNLVIGGNTNLSPVAQQELARIFKDIGVDVVLQNGAGNVGDVILQQNVNLYSTGFHPSGTNLAQIDNSRIMGYVNFYQSSYAPTDPYFAYGTGVARAAAHEIGHFLVGPGHSQTGIMRPGGNLPGEINEGLVDPLKKNIYDFTPQQGAEIRTKLGCEKTGGKSGKGAGGGGGKGNFPGDKDPGKPCTGMLGEPPGTGCGGDFGGGGFGGSPSPGGGDCFLTGCAVE